MSLPDLPPDGVHAQIANAPAQYIQVLAGPGTGKTFGLQHRVARLLQDSVEPSDILAVTFTRAAANALKNDLRTVGVEGAQQIQARTLHSLCFSALRRQRTMELTGRVPRPLLEFELEPLLADLPDAFAGENYSGKHRKQRAIKAFESAWAQLQHDEPGWPDTAHERQFHQQLLAWLVFHRSMLIGEVVPTMLTYLRDNPDAGPRYKHVLADEYQDLNRAEQDLVNQFAQGGSQLVIGDDDQSIYKFKFAHPDGIIEYPSRMPHVLMLATEECRRCPPLVVDMANALMTHQTNRLTDRILQCADPKMPQDVDVVRWVSLAAEAKGIARFVDAYLASHNEISPGQALVLSPRRQLGYMVRDELTALGRESRAYFQEQELDSLEAQRAFTLLRLLVDPADGTAIRWWLGHRARNWLVGTYARVRAHCEAGGEELHDVLDQMANGTLSIPRTVRLIDSWQELKRLLAEFGGLVGTDLVNALMPPDGEDVALLRTAAFEVVTDDMPPTILLEALGEMIRGPEVSQESEVIRVMSLHKSKGLTANLVVIVGMIDGLLPTTIRESPAADQEQMEEQRRLFYVALTRTRRALVLSSGRRMRTDLARRMGMFRVPPGPIINSAVSRFIGEVTPPAPPTLTPAQLAAKHGFSLET